MTRYMYVERSVSSSPIFHQNSFQHARQKFNVSNSDRSGTERRRRKASRCVVDVYGLRRINTSIKTPGLHQKYVFRSHSCGALCVYTVNDQFLTLQKSDISEICHVSTPRTPQIRRKRRRTESRAPIYGTTLSYA